MILFFLLLSAVLLNVWNELDKFLSILEERAEKLGEWEFKIPSSFTCPFILSGGCFLLVLGFIFILFANKEVLGSVAPHLSSKLLLASFIIGTFSWTLLFSFIAEMRDNSWGDCSILYYGSLILVYLLDWTLK